MIHVGLGEVLLLVAAFSLLAALAWVVRAVRGVRELGPPRCTRCGHDLRTYGPPPTACPECGMECARPGAVSFAHRRRRRRDLAWSGAWLLLTIASSVALVVWYTLGVSFPAAPPLPTLPELAAMAREGRTAPWYALPQILRRSPPTAEEREALIAALEAAGGAPGMGLDARTRSAMDDACATLLRFMDDDQRRRLAQAWLGPAVVELPSRIAVGEPWNITVRGRASFDSQVLTRTAEGLPRSTSPFVVAFRVLGVRVDGSSVRSASRRWCTEGVERIDLRGPSRAGPVDVEVEVARVILLADDVPRSGLPNDPDRWPPALDEPRSIVRRTVTAVGPEEELVERSVDPARRAQMDAALRIVACRIEGQGPNRVLVVETAVVPPGGMNIAGSWRVRIDDRVVHLGAIAAWGRPTNFAIDGEKRLVVPLAPDEAPDQVDVAIVPSSEAAAALPRTDVPAWGEVIERRGVPVQAR